MKAITIRDLRQRWPEAEAALELEGELLITRDSKPVAKLVRLVQTEVRRPRWSPEEHRNWIRKTFGKRVFASSDGQLDESRQDRKLKPALRWCARAVTEALVCGRQSVVCMKKR